MADQHYQDPQGPDRDRDEEFSDDSQKLDQEEGRQQGDAAEGRSNEEDLMESPERAG
ncbi:MAG TPA: hypothetical protein VIK60_04485 [Vicinamibacterales bacterium]